MKRSLTLFSFLFWVLFPPSCTTHNTASPTESLPPLSPKKSRLVVVNSTDGVNSIVSVDGRRPRSLAQGGMISFDLDPGFHRIEFHVPSLANSRAYYTPNFPPGETLYFAAIPSPAFRANRTEALRQGFPLDGPPLTTRHGPNHILFRKVTPSEASKIPFRW